MSILENLDELMKERLANPKEGSYTNSLLSDPIKAQRKVMEEAFETCLELKGSSVDKDALAGEAADLLYHLLALVNGAGVGLEDIETVLAERHLKPARHSTYNTND